MKDYDMLFESLVLAAWGGTFRRDDPLRMGDADTLRLADNELSGRNGHNAKFALSSALKKVAVENEGTAVNAALLDLDEKLWKARNINEMFQILEKTKTLFESLGMVIV
jgi:hypothetical protein